MIRWLNRIARGGLRIINDECTALSPRQQEAIDA